MRRVIVLGATGSIGMQALEVIAASEDLTVVGLSCDRNVEKLLRQAEETGCADLAIADTAAAEGLDGGGSQFSLRRGKDAAARLVREVDSDLVLNAIVGFAGLESTIAALESGKALALANKESLVCAGSLVMGLARKRRVEVLPVDSEHSALFQLIGAVGGEAVESVVITGSGGPFRGRKKDALQRVTKEEALAHPTWSMGAKVSVDSATLMNKGLEVIEARHLFGLPYERIRVVIHPQSIVHALVRMMDGALLAHMGMPDMKVPIAYALHHPDRAMVDTPRLRIEEGLELGFEPPDDEAFPALRLARTAGRKGDGSTCALNAANEVAVEAFLAGRLAFTDIPQVVSEVLEGEYGTELGTYQEAVDVDGRARHAAQRACERHAGKRSGRGDR